MSSGTPSSALYFEDCVVGRAVCVAAREVQQADLVAFARITGDLNPLHVDPEVARRTVFRGTVAHGMYVLSFAAGSMWQSGAFDGTVIAVEAVTSRFVAPVRPLDRLEVTLVVAALDAQPAARRGWVQWGVRARNQRGEVVLESEWRVVMARRREGA